MLGRDTVLAKLLKKALAILGTHIHSAKLLVISSAHVNYTFMRPVYPGGKQHKLPIRTFDRAYQTYNGSRRGIIFVFHFFAPFK
jgi:hypothetical protein